MTAAVCTGYVCFHCLGRDAPGCPRCVDGIDWIHVETCKPCRDRVPAIVGGAP